MFVELQTVKLLVPEIILLAAAAWIYLVAGPRRWWALFALAAYLVAGVGLLRQDQVLWSLFQQGAAADPSGPLAVDLLGHVFRWLALLVGLLLSLTLWHAGRERLGGELLGTLMLVVVGVMLVARANELVFLFLALELVTIPTYIVLFLGRRDAATAEATAKYFFLSVLASVLLLYGFSFLYGMAGTTLLAGSEAVPGIREKLEALHADGGERGLLALAPLALVLIVAGLSFKIAAVPFHFYAPDVYQGTTNANAGLLAVVPKVAGIVALVRLVVVAMPVAAEFAWQLVMVVAVLTMTLGNVCALWQTNLRRLMAYSSIAHAGYMLIGLTVGLAAVEQGVTGYNGVAAMLFYLVVYVLASLGMFAALAYLGSGQREVSRVDELAGLGTSRPLAAAAIAVCMLSLTGIPPLAGFWGKLTVFTSAMGLATAAGSPQLAFWFVTLAVVGVLNAAIAAAYYLRVVATMYFGTERLPVQAQGGWGAATATALSTLLVLAVGAMPGLAVHGANLAEQSARHRVAATEQAGPDQQLVSGQAE